MTTNDKKTALKHISDAYDALCPKQDQGTVWRIVSGLKADGCYVLDDHLRQAVNALADGLSYGNWPSAVKEMSSAQG